MKKRIAILSSILLLTCACGGGKQKEGLRIAALQGPSALIMENMPGGVEVYPDPLKLRAALLASEPDFAAIPTTLAALLYNKGLDYRLAAITMWGSFYICGRDTSIRSIGDLRGRRISVMDRGMTPDIVLRRLLSRSGIDPDRDVRLDYSFPGHLDLANAAMAGRADLFIMTEPYVSQITLSRSDIHVLLDVNALWKQTEGVPMAVTAFICKGSTPDSVIVRIVEDLRRSAAETDNPRLNADVRPATEVRDRVMNYLSIFESYDAAGIGGRLPDENFFVK